MKIILYIAIFLILCWVNLKSGSTGWSESSLWDLLAMKIDGLEYSIVYHVRLPALITSILAGAGLAMAGLLMQVLFQNQLAGPGIMGVSSGGAFAVSLAVLAGIGSGFVLPLYSMIGSVAVLVLIMLASHRFKSNSTVLILGLMFGYILSAAISILQYSAEAERLQQFVFWTMGGFHSTSWSEIPFMALTVCFCMVLIFSARKRLDIMLLGENQMTDLGLNFKQWRLYLLLVTGLIVGCVTAFCGPLAFIGLSAPHIARMFTRSDIHESMLPSSIYIGVVICLISLFVVQAPWMGFQLPLNAVLSIFGAPVVMWLLVRRSNLIKD